MEIRSRVRQGFVRFLFAVAAAGALVGCSGSNCIPVSAAKPTLVSLSIGPPYATLPAGYTQQYVVTALYSDGSKQPLPAAQVTWTSSNVAAATLSTTAPGTANTLTAGDTTITATLDGISASTPLEVTAAVLVSIEVTPTSASAPAGVMPLFKATGVYSDGSSHDITSAVTWSSSSAGVAGVSNAAPTSGVVTTLAAGSTLISASLSGVSGSTPLTVTSPTLVSIAVTPSSSNLPAGLTQAYVATGSYSDGSHQDLTSSVAWTSSSPGAATIAAGGLATGVSAGASTITATLGAVSATAALTVTAPTVVSIGVTPANSSVPKGTQPQLTAVATFSDGSTQVITTQAVWSSSNASVAAISNAGAYSGLATALGTGMTTVTATYEGVSGSSGLTVTAAALQSIEVTPSHSSIANGTTEAFMATGIYTDGTTQNLTQTATWSASTSGVASISNAAGTQGVATGASVGSTTITATENGVSGSTPLNVTAATLVSIAVTPATSSIASGTAQPFTATGTYTDNSTQNLTAAVTWSSSASAVATVSNVAGSNGVASSSSVGSTTITATLGSLSASAALTVTPAVLTSITVSPSTVSVASGYQQAFVATGHYTDNSTQTLTNSVTWSSSASSVATISNSAGSQGVASSGVVGGTTITATENGISGTASLNVTAAVLVSIAVTPASSKVFVGSTQPFVATGTYSDGSTQILTTSPSLVWSSSATPVATESNAAGTQGELTPLTQGSTVVSASVGGITGSTTVTVDLREFAYVLNAGSGSTANSISTYLVGNTGALTALGSGTVSSGGTQPFSIAIDSTRGNMYVTNIAAANYLTQFSIGANGSLTQVATYNGNFFNPAFLTLDRTNSYLYVANLDNPNAVNEYQIGTGGALTYIGSVSQGFTTPYHLVVDPSNRWLYVLGAFTSNVVQYSINASTGALTYVTSVAIPGGGTTAFIPELIAIDPAGTHAYVSAQYNNSQTIDGEVMEYSIDPTSGNLTLINTVAAQAYARSIVVDPTGSYVYVANVYGNSISEYSVGASGLQGLTTISTGAGSNPSALNLDPSGQYVYASLQGTNTIVEYSINADGTLNFLSSTSTGSGPDWVAIAN